MSTTSPSFPDFQDNSSESTRPFDDAYTSYDSRFPSQRFDSFTNFTDTDSSVIDDSSPIFIDTPPQPPIYVSSGGFESYEIGLNGKDFDQSDGPVLPSPEEMEADVGSALREWRKQNAIRLAEKEKKEKELLNEIIEEAEDYKIEFYRRRKLAMETNKSTNREKEKVFVSNQEKFHVEADKNYWKTIADLVPHEVVSLEKKRGKKDNEKKPSIVVIRGPKPGKPTDLSRMRQILVKLKQNQPPHMKTAPPPAPAPAPVPAQPKDPKSTSAATDITNAVPIVQPVAVA
ncbi:hypothetical protein GIB67_027443 [Kingdonia uniflora]|uniref:Clathrin light chain n=1 Tax=Kingdonia uniflora TaxID=39325 RepID=A0A7J7MFA8_9MAGN|nr:hypothetical protein GIB67_027443 [Kingdonia uniflora]